MHFELDSKIFKIYYSDKQSSYVALEIRLNIPLNNKNVTEIRRQNFIKRKSKGKPEPKNERSVILQFKGSCSLVTLNPQQSQIFTGVV